MACDAWNFRDDLCKQFSLQVHPPASFMNHLHSRHPNSYLFPLYLAYIVLIEDDIHWMNNTSSFMVYFRHLGVTLNSSILLNNFGGYNNNPTRPNICFFNYPVVVLFVVALPLLLFNLSFVPPCQRLSVLSFKPFPRILHLLFLFLLKGHQPAMLICFSVSTDAISPHFQHFLHLFVALKLLFIDPCVKILPLCELMSTIALNACYSPSAHETMQ